MPLNLIEFECIGACLCVQVCACVNEPAACAAELSYLANRAVAAVSFLLLPFVFLFFFLTIAAVAVVV